MMYWKFKNALEWTLGFASRLGNGLWRMGLYNGDYSGGTIVDEEDIDTRPYGG